MPHLRSSDDMEMWFTEMHEKDPPMRPDLTVLTDCPEPITPLLNDMWHQNPAARPTALVVEQRLTEMLPLFSKVEK
jgi:hypothetical protein